VANDNVKLLHQLRKDFRASVNAEQRMREDGKRSRDFSDGDQWRPEDRRDRVDHGRHAFDFNELRKFIKQLSGDMRQNMPRLDVVPIRNAGFSESQIMGEVGKYIEESSDAEDAFQTAAEWQLNSGLGFWYYDFEDSKVEPNSKDIVVRRVTNRFTIYLDQTAKKYTYADGKYAFITEMLTKDEYKEEYPKAAEISFETALGDYPLDWHEEGQVRVAIYYYKKKKMVTLVKLFNPFTGEINITELTDEVTKEDLTRGGLLIVDEGEVEKDIVWWCKASGAEILEGPEEFPCEFIPIVPVIGYEENDNGERLNRSLIHDAIPSQEAYNYATTKMIERIALEPMAPIVATPAQIKNFEYEYENANRLNLAVIPFNPDPMHPGAPSRLAMPQASPALINLAIQAKSDINDIIGRGLASVGQPNKERTGAAIEASKRSSDVTTYTFFSNFLKSMQHGGRIMLSMIKRLMDNERTIRIYGTDNQLLDLTINEVVRDPLTGEEIVYNDLTKGEYDYKPVSTIGQLTKRQEMKQSLIDIMTIAPEARPAFLKEFVDVSDYPNKEKIKEVIDQVYARQEVQQQLEAGQQQGAPLQEGQTALGI
jgi:hypothetical protein